MAALTAQIAALIQACLAMVPDQTKHDASIVACAEAALAEAAAAAAVGGDRRTAALRHLLRHFGWNGAGFARPLDARYLASRLRALLFDGLVPCGAGTFSSVYTARCLLTGSKVALKRMTLERLDEGLPATALREISLLRQLADCPHIIQLLDVMWDQNRLYLVFEAMGRDLRAHLDAEPAARQLPRVKSVMYQLLKGVAHAHAHRVIHRDLKPHNVLINPATGAVKVADFGLARTLTPPLRPYTREVVTLLYRAPELLLGSALYSMPVDVWSVGCILAELATGQPLFQGDSEIGQLMAIFSLLGAPTEEVWPGVSSLPLWQACLPRCRPRDLAQELPQLGSLGLDLLSSLLQYDPARRISCGAALAHPFFDEVRAQEEARGNAIQAAVLQARHHQQACMQAAAATAHELTLQRAGARSASLASDQTGVLSGGQAAPASSGGGQAAPASSGGGQAAPASSGGGQAAPSSTCGGQAAPSSNGGGQAAPASTRRTNTTS